MQILVFSLFSEQFLFENKYYEGLRITWNVYLAVGDPRNDAQMGQIISKYFLVFVQYSNTNFFFLCPCIFYPLFLLLVLVQVVALPYRDYGQVEWMGLPFINLYTLTLSKKKNL